MPWEDVGECGSGSLPEDASWVDFCHETALNYLKLALGDPPEGCELGMRLNDHELGSYPTIGVYWAFPVADAPWDYINRAEELLDLFNHAIQWEKLWPLPEYSDEQHEQPESNEEDAEMPIDNPSPMSLTYFTYKDKEFGCKHCGWQGLGEYLEFGEEFEQLVELDCPACHTKLSFVMYPTLAEAQANKDRMSEDERAHLEAVEKAQARFEELGLKTPAQLPEIQDREFSIVWDIAEDMTVLRLGERVIFSEPVFYECYERFEQVAHVLKSRYGAALLDLVPTAASNTYLYGDSLFAAQRIAEFRRATFGGN